MEELLQAPTEGYGEAIVIVEINTDHFEIKMNLLQLVQVNPYHGFEREFPHTCINNFKRITSTLKFRDVPNDVIKLMMFPYSLKGSARRWYDKEPPNSILTWKDLVNKFVNQFFPPSKTTHLKNEISRFTHRFVETFREARERFKEMLRACENLLSKTTREVLHIIENKSKVRHSKNKPNVSRMNTTSRENATVEESCVTCGGNHAYYNYDATNSSQSSVCAATEPNVPKTLPKPNIPYPSRHNDQKLREKPTNQMEKFFQIFQDLHFDISKRLRNEKMPKFASTIKSLLANKDKLFELAKILLVEGLEIL
nr:hypothetical protein [Tanacetum cinerariifolium]